MNPALRDLRLAVPAIAGLAAALGTAGATAINSLIVTGVCAFGSVLALTWAGLITANSRAPTATGGRFFGGVRWADATEDRAALMVLSLALFTAGACAAVQAADHRAVDVHPLTALTGGTAQVQAQISGFAQPLVDGVVTIPVRITDVSEQGETIRARLSTHMVMPARWDRYPPGTKISATVDVRASRHSGRAPEIRPHDIPTETHPAGLRGDLPHAARSKFRDVAGGLPTDAATQLLPALVLGDESGVTEQTRQNFRQSGLSHLSAVSGANFTLVVGAVVLIAGFCGARRRGRLVAGTVALLVFVAVVGSEPSVLRAAGTGMIGLVAVAGQRSARPLAALSAVVLLVALLAPQIVSSAAFLLSVAATSGLVVAARPVSECLQNRSWPGPCADLVSMCAVSYVATLPVLLLWRISVSTWALLANIVVAPVVPLVTLCGTASAALAMVWPQGAHLVALPAVPALWWLDVVAAKVAELPGSAPRR